MSELPNGWLTATMQDVVINPQQDIVDGPFGSNLKASEYQESGIPIIRLQNVARNRFIDKNIKYISEVKADELQRHSFIAGDIAVTKLGDPLGKAAIIPSSFSYGIIVADIVRLRIDPRYADSRYVTYAINSTAVCAKLAEETKGTTRPRVNLGHIRSLEFPVAPINEQKRIADKLDTLLARVDACRSRLENVPRLLKRFRQAVLTAATSGELTSDWRKEHGVNITDWEDSLLGNCGIVSGGLTKNAKRASLSLKKPYLRVANVYMNRLELDDVTEIGLTDSEYEKTRLVAGDLLIVEGNGSIDQLGRVAIWNDAIDECVHQNHIIRWRTIGILPKYVLLWLMSPRGRNDITDLASTTTGLYTLSISKVSALPIDLPSINEQHEIVRRVETLFAYADCLEARYTAARSQVDQLTPVLLEKAFRGELVSQDPNDEPATMLLERVSAARVAESARPRRQMTGRKSQMTQVSTDSVRELLLELPQDSFTFDELRKDVATDYETLKDIIFTLLSEATPSIRQVFDPATQAMRFERVIS